GLLFIIRKIGLLILYQTVGHFFRDRLVWAEYCFGAFFLFPYPGIREVTTCFFAWYSLDVKTDIKNPSSFWSLPFIAPAPCNVLKPYAEVKPMVLPGMSGFDVLIGAVFSVANGNVGYAFPAPHTHPHT